MTPSTRRLDGDRRSFGHPRVSGPDRVVEHARGGVRRDLRHGEEDPRQAVEEPGGERQSVNGHQRDGRPRERGGALRGAGVEAVGEVDARRGGRGVVDDPPDELRRVARPVDPAELKRVDQAVVKLGVPALGQGAAKKSSRRSSSQRLTTQFRTATASAPQRPAASKSRPGLVRPQQVVGRDDRHEHARAAGQHEQATLDHLLEPPAAAQRVDRVDQLLIGLRVVLISKSSRPL